MRALIIISLLWLFTACAGFEPYTQAISGQIIGTWESKNGSFPENNREGFDQCEFFANGTFFCSTFYPQSCIGLEYAGRWDKVSGQITLSRDTAVNAMIAGISGDTLVIRRKPREIRYTKVIQQ